MSSEIEYSDTNTESISSYSSNSYIQVRTRSTRRLYLVFIAVFSLCCIGTILSIPAMLPKITNEDHITVPTTEVTSTTVFTNAASQNPTVFYESTTVGFTSYSPNNISPVDTTLETQSRSQTTDNIVTSAYYSTTASKDKHTTESAELILTSTLISSSRATSELVSEYIKTTQMVTQTTFLSTLEPSTTTFCSLTTSSEDSLVTTLAPIITTLNSLTTSSEDPSSSIESTSLRPIETTFEAEHTTFMSTLAIPSATQSLPTATTLSSVIEITSPSLTTQLLEISTSPDKSLQPGDYYIETESNTNLSRWLGTYKWPCWIGHKSYECVGQNNEKREIFSVKKQDGFYVINVKENDLLRKDIEYWTAVSNQNFVILDNDDEVICGQNSVSVPNYDRIQMRL
ncbi:unnamed protein product [Oikopleura dioica]|uniref:Uncharacterized protein n=1 Tax=Oikopleura dioica TaxID=34765 RepID=E4YM59_OIKDI|nr:unnamed protein product [Oikopleura dioica]